MRAWLAVRRVTRGDRGSSAVELAILVPVLLLASLLIIQFAMWFDARHAALAAAQDGDRLARGTAATTPGWRAQASQEALNYYRKLDTSVLSNVQAPDIEQNGNNVSVTITGTLNGIFRLRISETVSGPIECFRTQATQGKVCPVAG